MLIDTLTALENVILPAELAGVKNAKQKALDMLEKVGLSHRLTHMPKQLSGGEQQRVAIARAFISEPKVLFADEPTGNLDGDNSAKIERMLFDLNTQSDTTLVVITHDLALANQCQRQVRMVNGQLAEVTSEKQKRAG